MTPLGIILAIANIAVAVVWPNKMLDWLNYMAAGMMIATIILVMVMRG